MDSINAAPVVTDAYNVVKNLASTAGVDTDRLKDLLKKTNLTPQEFKTLSDKLNEKKYLVTSADPWASSSSYYKLGPLEQKSLDPEWQKSNPALAAYNYPGSSDIANLRRYNTLANQLSRFGLKYLVRPSAKLLNYTTSFSPFKSTVATGGVGFLGGSLLDKILGLKGINSRFDILLGTTGAAIGNLLGGANVKRNAYNFSMKKESNFVKFGKSLGLAANNVPAEEAVPILVKEDYLKNDLSKEYGYVQKMACKLASVMYEVTNQKHKLEYHLFDKLANAKGWATSLDPYSDAIFETVGVVNSAAETNANEAVKCADSGILKKVFSDYVPSILGNSLMFGAATGGSLGALAWLLNRHATEDTTQNEILKQQIDYYNLMTDELSDKLKAKGLIVDQEDPEAKEKQLV
jgi:DNA-binding MarR family transcriptional regulator